MRGVASVSFVLYICLDEDAWIQSKMFDALKMLQPLPTILKMRNLQRSFVLLMASPK